MPPQEFDITILTERRYYQPNEISDYVANILLEDDLIGEALKNMGYKVTRKSWDDAHFDWSTTKYVLFRTTWDYFDRFPEFRAWLNRVEGVTRGINSINTIKWNWDKHYLTLLKEAGINIPPTTFIPRHSGQSLSQVFHHSGWEKAVMKPTVSGAARHTYVVTAKNIDEYEGLFQKLLTSEDMMLQEFQDSISSFGEVSLMMFGGSYSHAVLKKAKKGDFRVQDDFGGSLHNYSPSDDMIRLAQNALKACPEPTAYARVDIILDGSGLPAISELELIEPELWLRRDQASPIKMANAIKSHIEDE